MCGLLGHTHVSYVTKTLTLAPSVCYEEVFVAIDLQDWVALSKIEHDWQSSSRLSLFELRFVPKGPNLASIIEKKGDDVGLW